MTIHGKLVAPGPSQNRGTSMYRRGHGKLVAPINSRNDGAAVHRVSHGKLVALPALRNGGATVYRGNHGKLVAPRRPPIRWISRWKGRVIHGTLVAGTTVSWSRHSRDSAASATVSWSPKPIYNTYILTSYSLSGIFCGYVGSPDYGNRQQLPRRNRGSEDCIQGKKNSSPPVSAWPAFP